MKFARLPKRPPVGGPNLKFNHLIPSLRHQGLNTDPLKGPPKGYESVCWALKKCSEVEVLVKNQRASRCNRNRFLAPFLRKRDQLYVMNFNEKSKEVYSPVLERVLKQQGRVC